MRRRLIFILEVVAFIALFIGGAALQERVNVPGLTGLFFIPAGAFVWVRLSRKRGDAVALLVGVFLLSGIELLVYPRIPREWTRPSMTVIMTLAVLVVVLVARWVARRFG